MGGRVVMQARTGIFDQYRGVFLNRGVFVKAPPDFFHAYPSAFAKPPQGWERLKLKLREIPENWNPQTGFMPAQQVGLVPNVQVPPPAPTPVAEAVQVEAAVAEPVAASDNVQQTTSDAEAYTTLTVAPPKRRGRPPGSKNKPKNTEE